MSELQCAQHGAVGNLHFPKSCWWGKWRFPLLFRGSMACECFCRATHRGSMVGEPGLNALWRKFIEHSSRRSLQAPRCFQAE